MNNRISVVKYHLDQLKSCIDYEFSGCEYDPIYKHFAEIENFIETILEINKAIQLMNQQVIDS